MPARTTRAGVLMGTALLLACGEPEAPIRPQWKVYIATDTPLPALGDQVMIEVRDGSTGELTGVRRQLDVPDAKAWPLSFGVVPDANGAAPRLRVRLFRQDQTDVDGEPPADTTIEALARLPPAPHDGILEVAITLSMACFGKAAQLDAQRTCDTTSGELAPEPVLSPLAALGSLPTPGSWPHAKEDPCPSAVPDGMVCVPGGAFLLGGPQESPLDDTDSVRQRVVRISAFALDRDEVTVGMVRQLVQDRGLPAPEQYEFCTYLGLDDAANDDMPVNCISWSAAGLACGLLGKRLPTEAEWEYAAGNRGLKTRYPWGSAPDICFRAVVGRGGIYTVGAESSEACLRARPTLPKSPLAGGAPADVTSLGIRNLAGNVMEWMADRSAPFDAPCWQGPVPLVDPRCAEGGNPSLRGASWASVPNAATTWSRNAARPAGSSWIGFRCAASL